MKRWFQYDLLRRITLRFIETGRRFRFAKNVADTVIAKPVSGTEVGVGVVVERTPANAPRILGIRRKLVMNTSMTNGVLSEALHIVDGLGGIGVTHEFSIQVAGVIRRLQWESEVVHGKHIFQELRLLGIADPPGLARRIKLMRQGVRPRVKVMIVPGFVDAHTPQNDRRMVPVAPDHPGDVVDRKLLPSLIADVLPSGDLFQNEQTHLVAGVEEMTRLRVVGGADDIALELFPKYLGIATLTTPRHCLAREWERLVPVEAAKLDYFTVQLKAMISETGLPKTKATGILIEYLGPSLQTHANGVEIRLFKIP